MSALTIRLRTDDDRIAVERWKDATGTRTASRTIVRAVREWADLVDEFAAERRTVDDLPLPVETFAAAAAGSGPGVMEDSPASLSSGGPVERRPGSRRGHASRVSRRGRARARPEMARVPISGTGIRASHTSRPYAGSPRGANAEASPSTRSSRW